MAPGDRRYKVADGNRKSKVEISTLTHAMPNLVASRKHLSRWGMHGVAPIPNTGRADGASWPGADRFVGSRASGTVSRAAARPSGGRALRPLEYSAEKRVHLGQAPLEFLPGPHQWLDRSSHASRAGITVARSRPHRRANDQDIASGTTPPAPSSPSGRRRRANSIPSVRDASRSTGASPSVLTTSRERRGTADGAGSLRGTRRLPSTSLAQAARHRRVDSLPAAPCGAKPVKRTELSEVKFARRLEVRAREDGRSGSRGPRRRRSDIECMFIAYVPYVKNIRSIAGPLGWCTAGGGVLAV